MCDEYRLNADMSVALGGDAEALVGPEKIRLSKRGFACRPGDTAPVLVPVDPNAPEAGLRWIFARWWLVPSFHHGATSTWRIGTALARLENLETRYAFREPYRYQRALAPFTSFIVYSPPSDRGRRSPERGWSISWRPIGPGDTVRFFPAVWDRATVPGETRDLLSFAIVVGQPAKEFSLPGRPGALARRQPRLLTRDQGVEWLRLDGPGKQALIDPRPSGGFEIADWSRGVPDEGEEH